MRILIVQRIDLDFRNMRYMKTDIIILVFFHVVYFRYSSVHYRDATWCPLEEGESR